MIPTNANENINRNKVKAPIAGQYPIAGQSHEFFSKLEIYESLIAILVYRIQTVYVYTLKKVKNLLE